MPLRTALYSALFAAAILAAIVQAIIDPSIENLYCTCLVLGTTLTVLLYFIWTDALIRNPLSAFVLLGFCATTQFGALVVQSLLWTPLRSSLYDARLTFGNLSFYLLIAIGTHAVYRFFSSRNTEPSLTRQAFSKLGFYRIPSPATLWIMGAIGLVTFVFLDGGGLAKQVAKGFNFLVWAPFLIPYYMLREGPSYWSPRLAKVLVPLHAVLIAVVGIAVNIRSTMFTGIATIGLLYLLHALRSSDARLSGQMVWRAALVGGIFALIMDPLSDFTISMAIAREKRGEITATEMISRTLDIYKQPHLIDAYNENASAQVLSAYDEHYIDNSMFSRLVETKFHDNALHFGALITREDDKARLWDLTMRTFWGVFPTPVLRLLGINVNKGDMHFSMGDYLAHLARGESLGSYRTGSLFAQGKVLFGNMFPIIYVFCCLFAFHALELMTARPPGVVPLVTAAAMMKLWALFLHGITGDQLEHFLSFVLRGLVEMVILYAITLCIASVILRGRKVFHDSAPA